MNITLRAGERFFINGAVIRIDRKATIELSNDVTFLLENHVMQAEGRDDADPPDLFRRADHADGPDARPRSATPLARSLIETALGAYRTPELIAGLRGVAQSLARGRNFEAMKALRALFPLEDARASTASPAAERRLKQENAMTVNATSPVATPPIDFDRLVVGDARATQSLGLQRLPDAADGGDEEPGPDPADGPVADGVAARDRLRGRAGGADQHHPGLAPDRDLADARPSSLVGQTDHLRRRLDLGRGRLGQRDERGRGGDADQWRRPFRSPAARACSERGRRDRSRPVGDLDGRGRRGPASARRWRSASRSRSCRR